MAMTIQVTGKLKSNGKKQTVTGVAIEGSGEFFYSLIFLEGDSLLFLSKKMRFLYITKKTWLILVCWNIYSDICATMLLWRWPSTDHFCYKTSWRWVWESESFSLSHLFRDCQRGPSQLRKGELLIFGFEKYSTTVWLQAKFTCKIAVSFLEDCSAISKVELEYNYATEYLLKTFMKLSNMYIRPFHKWSN